MSRKKKKTRALVIVMVAVVLVGMLAWETLIGIPRAPFNNPTVTALNRDDDYGRFYDVAAQYAADIDRLYFNNVLNTSIDYLNTVGLMQGRPTLWPYHTIVMMNNRMLMSMEDDDPNREYFEKFLKTALTALSGIGRIVGIGRLISVGDRGMSIIIRLCPRTPADAGA